jgi:hypothetical protein
MPTLPELIARMQPPPPPKRKAFISFYQGNRTEADNFILLWSVLDQIFISKALGTFENQDFIDSKNPDYVMQRIRGEYLGDSTVTIVLIGSCTHSRRYVDWELKTSLRRGEYTPNGLLGILLPSAAGGAYLPPRFEANWARNEVDCYARYRHWPTSGDQLRGWIEDAYAARTSRDHLIQNAAEMMRYNARCKVCAVTH